MILEEELRYEIDKWLNKAESLIPRIRPLESKGKDFLTNINAYIKDSRYFLEKKDLIRSFEAIIWAWAWCEIGKEIGILDY
ncbi:MAG: DUF357 domain-containing protein [Candidatus Hydrothermarchaeota archaeon]